MPGAGASGYDIYLYDGNSYRQVDQVGDSATSWAGQDKGIYPTDSQSLAGRTTPVTPLQHHGSCNLRDDPNALYKATAGATGSNPNYKSRTDYRFCVLPYYSDSSLPSITSSEPTVACALDNRTQHVRETERTTDYDLGSFVNHDFSCSLNKGRLNATTTDLAIDSWGPDASLTRTYYSTRISNPCSAPAGGLASSAPSAWPATRTRSPTSMSAAAA